jgi:hypothetical protein
VTAVASRLRLVFLGSGPFRYKDPDYAGWIVLDFLGFSRPNLDLSMGYKGFSAENFSTRFLQLLDAPDGAPAVLGLWAQEHCWDKHSPTSDFSQGIAVDPAPY